MKSEDIPLDYHQIQLYQKITLPSGRNKYIPAERIYEYDIIKPGTSYLVQGVKSGGISTVASRKFITPEYAPILAALREFQEEALNILREANEAKSPRALTPLEQKAVKAYQDVMGEKSSVYFEGISMYDLIQKLIDFLESKIVETLLIPTPSTQENGEQR